MNTMFIKIADFFEKVFALPRIFWFFAVVVIGLPILTSVTMTSKSLGAAIIASIVAITWVVGIAMLACTIAAPLKEIETYSAGAQWGVSLTIITLSTLILAPIPALTIVMALEVGRLAGIATGSCLAILYWLLLRIFPKLKFWDSTNPQECASS